MADSDSDSADCQTPKKAKLVLTVKEKEERYMAAAKIMPNYDTMVSHRAIDLGFLLFHLCLVRGGKARASFTCVRNMATRARHCEQLLDTVASHEKGDAQ